MNAAAIIFYIISAFILGTGILAVTTRKIFRSAIWLLFSLIGIAALYFWMQVEFIAAVQIIVYVGGIVVLIIFSIFLTQRSGAQMAAPAAKRNIFAILAALFGFAFSYNLISQYEFPASATQPFVVNVADIGERMLSLSEHGFVLPFELVSMLLLAAMIGCIVIAMKIPENRKGRIISPPDTSEIQINPVPEPQKEEVL
ncbi:NADH-quinone oxidoreductase subunit J [Flavihumibacter sp. ZG627]|uniref:NADH-quinone oxidoreductase subunit J family protein n=1 Tax=Flavihumibacter sp. ZG627 TaxID=1463156 RepID=UPI000693FBEF|nr:NADH-quinone oxidoreductase subunit J [Flavihumibacter sp. ZG627]